MGNIYANLNYLCGQNSKNRSDYLLLLSDQNADDQKGTHKFNCILLRFVLRLR